MYNQALQTYLEGFLSPERAARIKEVVAQRTRHVTIVLEDVWQPQNASAAIRTSECMGLQEVHIIKNGEGYKINKQVVKGASKWMEIHKYTKKENNTRTCLTQLKDRGYKIVATVPGENSGLLTKLDVKDKTAFVFGSEKNGVSDEVLELCDSRISIPMFGFTESYNISVSVAISLFHFINETKKQNIRWSLDEREQNELLQNWTKQSIKKCDLLVQEFFTKHGGKKEARD
jgi:tRNA (guanosine-2'-O-)-methyltransferase